MMSVAFRITRKDYNYLRELVGKGYAVSNSEALRRMLKESRFYLTNYLEAKDAPVAENHCKYRTRFKDDVLEKLIEKGVAKVDPTNGLMVLDESSLNAICNGENPKNRMWVPYNFYECPLHSRSLDRIARMAESSLEVRCSDHRLLEILMTYPINSLRPDLVILVEALQSPHLPYHGPFDEILRGQIEGPAHLGHLFIQPHRYTDDVLLLIVLGGVELPLAGRHHVQNLGYRDVIAFTVLRRYVEFIHYVHEGPLKSKESELLLVVSHSALVQQLIQFIREPDTHANGNGLYLFIRHNGM